MFCSIRQYEGCTDVNALQTRVEKEFLPTIRDMPGFQSYAMIDHDDGDVTVVSMFDTQDQAHAANQEVAKLVEASLTDLLPEDATILLGEVIIDSRR